MKQEQKSALATLGGGLAIAALGIGIAAATGGGYIGVGGILVGLIMAVAGAWRFWGDLIGERPGIRGFSVQRWAIQSLGEMNEPRAIAPLLAVLTDPRYETNHTEVERALEEITEQGHRQGRMPRVALTHVHHREEAGRDAQPRFVSQPHAGVSWSGVCNPIKRP